MSVFVIDISGKQHEVSLDEIVWRPSVYGIVIDNGKVLLSPQHGKGYDLPGGGMEINENFHEAVVREVKEETGIDVKVLGLVDARDSLFAWKPEDPERRNIQHSVMLYFLCEKIGGELSVDGFDEQEREYAQLAEWIDVAEVAELPLGSTVDFRPIIMKAIGN